MLRDVDDEPAQAHASLMRAQLLRIACAPPSTHQAWHACITGMTHLSFLLTIMLLHLCCPSSSSKPSFPLNSTVLCPSYFYFFFIVCSLHNIIVVYELCFEDVYLCHLIFHLCFCFISVIHPASAICCPYFSGYPTHAHFFLFLLVFLLHSHHTGSRQLGCSVLRRKGGRGGARWMVNGTQDKVSSRNT